MMAYAVRSMHSAENRCILGSQSEGWHMESTEQNANRIRILLAEDHVFVREGLRQLLVRESDMEVVGKPATANMRWSWPLKLVLM